MSDRPNVLLLLGSGHSHRCLGHLDRPGAEPVHTPTLDGLAAEGTAFTDAYTPLPLPAPARVAALSGRTPTDLGVWDGGCALPDEPLSLPAALGDAGYDTALVGSLGVAGARQFGGFDARPYGDFTGQGGAQYDPLTPLSARGSPHAARTSHVGGEWGHRYDPLDGERRSPDPWRSLAGDAGPTHVPESASHLRAVARETVSWVRERAVATGGPWFATASFSAPRPPLTAPDRHLDRYAGEVTDPAVTREGDAADHPLVAAKADADRTTELPTGETVDLDAETVREARAAYFAGVSHLDEVLGDLLGDLRRGGHLEDTVVVYAADHGELAGEHGLWWHAAPFEGAVRVPLVVQTPGHRRGDHRPGQVSTPVSLLDVAPTLGGLTGVAVPEADGADLSSAVADGVVPDRGPVTVDFPHPRWGAGTEFRAVRDGDSKYVHFRDAPDLAFDLERDPLECENRADGSVPSAARRDFAAAAERRAADRERSAEVALSVPDALAGNAYHLRDGRVVDADPELYNPGVVAQSAETVFEDHPEDGE